jgi:hypothetical protein
MILFKLIKLLFKALGLLIVAVLTIFFVIYAIAPVYKFPEYEAFSGNKIFNPYAKMDSTAWKKGNFQVQSRAWLGLTSGRNNLNPAIFNVYQQLGYNIIAISDYMKINRYGEDKEGYVPTYEHGYGIRKTHQVCIGANKVNWIDYPFYQNIHHKQHILNVLRRNNEIVTLAHPDLRDGYLLEDMQQLTNYDLIEVLNEIRFSLKHWDAALSAGHAKFILANDDAHDIYDPSEVGRICTYINTPTLEADDIISALKGGNAFGADIAMEQGDNFLDKAQNHKTIPVLNSVKVQGDTLTVAVSERAEKFSFIGQNGVVAATVSDTSTASYVIKPGDTYIRTEILFSNKNKFYLNPVFRYSGNKPSQQPTATIDHVKTYVQRGVALIIVIILIIISNQLFKLRKKKNRINRNFYYYSR